MAAPEIVTSFDGERATGAGIHRSSEAGLEPGRSVALGVLAVYGVMVLRTAWMSDDVFITLRTVDNFVNGLGLRWNVDERVQSYTHPLWMLVLALGYAVTREPFYTTIFISVLTSLLAVGVLVRFVAKSSLHAVVAVSLLALSKSFVDFSTSGLENPLSHLLIAIFAYLYLVRGARLRSLAFVAGLIMLTRSDVLLVVLPSLAEAIFRARKSERPLTLLRELLQGFAPAVAWSVFSLVYYGFLVPNTAFAKLNTGFPAGLLFRQGAVYLLNGVAWDPALVAALIAGLGLPLLSRQRRQLFLTAGVVLYLGYILRVGGDFMAGRFLTVPLFAAVCGLATLSLPFRDVRSLAVFGAPFLLLLLTEGATEGWKIKARTHGIESERRFYRDSTSLMMTTRNFDLPDHRWRRDGARLARRGPRVKSIATAGMIGFYAGPRVHLIDIYALTDPLLARLPARDPEKFRIGHYRRRLPEGYLESVASGDCKMSDASLCVYYTKLRLIISGPIGSWTRLKTIAAMNLGLYDHWLEPERAAAPKAPESEEERASEEDSEP